MHTPKTPQALPQLIQLKQDEDIDIEDNAEEEEDLSGTSSEEEIDIDHAETLTHHTLLSTITIKKKKINYRV